MQHPRFKLVVECVCGRRYFRHYVQEQTERDTRAVCQCGVVLGAWSGAFSFWFESERDRHLRQSGGAGLSPHC